MSASHHLGIQFNGPTQLPLFMSGQAIKNSITMSGDMEAHETLPTMWDRKVDESKDVDQWDDEGHWQHGNGVYESISKKGWAAKHPLDVSITRNNDIYIPDAHHRVASAADIEEKTGKEHYIPVAFHGPKHEEFGHHLIPHAMKVKQEKQRKEGKK